MIQLVLPFIWAFEAQATSGVTYHGRLLKPNRTPVISNMVRFRLQIRTPGPEDCLLYEEIQVLDMSRSQGAFSLSINDGTGFRQDTHNWNLFD